MWSKTKQVMESRLADCLKGHVSFQMEKYRTADYQNIMEAFYIRVDKETWFATNIKAVIETEQIIFEKIKLIQQENPKLGYWEIRTDELTTQAEYEMIRQTGWQDIYKIGKEIHQYLSVYSIEECLNSEDYILRLFAVLDARVGKRRIQKLLDHIEEEPEWFRKWILLRTGMEKLL